MKKGIQTQHKIKAPITDIWDLIKTGEKWEDWLPILAGSKVVGNTRTCDVPTPDGNKDIFEEIFLVSDLEKTFVYQIHKQHSFPATDIVGYIKLEENGNSTTMYWSVEMNVASDEIFTELKGQIEHIYAEGASKLEELATTAA
ncbi:SRPBCC family protein [Spongiimicrobium sp. 2-473A-2-J]|uniref:SRPBCC family protein n=1 Tax=Eudoraea algarum TaxID=3417568 RepID=UPI003D36259F